MVGGVAQGESTLLQQKEERVVFTNTYKHTTSESLVTATLNCTQHKTTLQKCRNIPLTFKNIPKNMHDTPMNLNKHNLFKF